MADETTLFSLPNTPDEFGVVLPSPNLRRLDFSGLDYTTARRAIIEYIKTYFPDTFNDFVASNGIIMIMEIVAAVVDKLALRSDILANEATLPTAKTEEAIINHIALIGQRIKRQTPAIIDMECSINQPSFTDIEIDAGTSFNISGPDGKQVIYEIYRAPNDWTSKIVIPAGKRGIIAWGIEGVFAAPINVISAGGASQRFVIEQDNVLESPIFVYVTLGVVSEEWKVISEPIERYGPEDKVVEVNFIESKAIFRFGDNLNGRIPVSGSTIEFKFRVGGGSRGRIGVGQIDISKQITPLPPANAVTSVRFRNITPSSGGVDKESLDKVKQRAPRDFAVQRSIVTDDDYAQVASSFSHPVYGTVSKAVATIRTALNANLVEIYVLAVGADNTPTLPSTGLKVGLETYFADLNVFTDHVAVLDGAIRPVDIDLTIIVGKNVDASVVKDRVESTITNYFAISNWEIGQSFFLSNFIEAIETIDGIIYVNVLSPSSNILPTGKISDPTSNGIGFNEVIVEGKRRTNYFYEKTPSPGGIRSGS